MQDHVSPITRIALKRLPAGSDSAQLDRGESDKDWTRSVVQGGALALVAAQPGRMRDGLRTLLAAMPLIDGIEQADDGASALRMIAERRPTLVLLDTNLPDDEVWVVLRRIKAQRLQTRCLVMADTSQQRQTALVTGADGVLIKGFSTRELFAAIEELLSGLTLIPEAEWNGRAQGGRKSHD
jgi:DNA-binding NarL/FixJ family response regulator